VIDALLSLPRWAWMSMIELTVVAALACMAAFFENRARIRWKARADAARLVLLNYSRGVEQKIGAKKAARLAGRAEIETSQQVRDRLDGVRQEGGKS
jgi:hypothetical protein